jgi:hypothetical protein
MRNKRADNLIKILASSSPKIRNRVALKLKDLKYNQAVKPLLSAIFKKGNRHYNGTLVYALQDLDCSHYLKEIFQILFFEGYEAKYMAYQILYNQEFIFTKKDLLKIQKTYQEFSKIAPRNDDETNEMILATFEGFISYLE